LTERLCRNVMGSDGEGREFEIDVLISDLPSAAVIEFKAAWIRDDTVLHPDPEEFIAEVRRKYGWVPSGTDRGKGVAQLAVAL